MLVKNVYKVSIVMIILITWLLMYTAHISEYDVNYGYFIYSMLISTLTIMGIVVLWFKRRIIIKENSLVTICFLTTASPVSILIFIELYQTLIGRYFKL